ncbi:hypothetical protein L484_012252 [Morus notabilis]|uniref:Uncharacterized protein n=1 Tax=Morus notabilis TaxID=981085 RepID=W9RMZ3_9ROSA|nr:hypothetical protein L484_012252 [Morus notabilis]
MNKTQAQCSGLSRPIRVTQAYLRSPNGIRIYGLRGCCGLKFSQPALCGSAQLFSPTRAYPAKLHPYPARHV